MLVARLRAFDDGAADAPLDAAATAALLMKILTTGESNRDVSSTRESPAQIRPRGPSLPLPSLASLSARKLLSLCPLCPLCPLCLLSPLSLPYTVLLNPSERTRADPTHFPVQSSAQDKTCAQLKLHAPQRHACACISGRLRSPVAMDGSGRRLQSRKQRRQTPPCSHVRQRR